MSIRLSAIESKIFDYLLDVNNEFNLDITFRVAGGWVRDKILGKESDDIDIALDNMTGKQFCKHLQKKKESINIHIIQQNHEQCKHLEVASVTIHGIVIDLVNLRSETYETSRIPITEVGTPKQDALRRDLTINSMFYNINNGKIEDHTGLGMSDIADKVIRTPLDPYKTFVDDPLRILRAIRFSVRLGFTLEKTIIETIKTNKDIRNMLMDKVTPERRLAELRKMMKHNAFHAIQLLHDIDIFECIFDTIYKIYINSDSLIHVNSLLIYLTIIYYGINNSEKQTKNDYTVGKQQKKKGYTVIEQKLNNLKVTNQEKRKIMSMETFCNNVINISTKDELSIAKHIYILGDKDLLNDSVTIIKTVVNDETQCDLIVDIVKKFSWCVGLECLLNGHEIMKYFNAKGKEISEFKDRIIDLQIANKDCNKDFILDSLSLN